MGSMSDFVYQLAIWLPSSMIAWALVWYMSKLLGGTGAAFSVHALITWPLTLVLAAGALFGLIAGGLGFTLGENLWSRLTASGVAALVSVGLLPRLWVHLFPPASRSSHPGEGARRDE